MVGGKAEKIEWGKIVAVFKYDGKEFELYPVGKSLKNMGQNMLKATL